MNKLLAILFISVSVVTAAGCKKYLDVNRDEDTPQFPDPSSVFPTQLAAIPRGLQFDARYAMRYVQNFGVSDAGRSATETNWDRMGYASGVDNNGDIWRQAYFGMGQNLNYIITVGERNGQYDYVGAAYALQALIFQYTTDYHSEIIFSEAFREQAFFKFDDQESVYHGIDSICKLALHYLSRTDGSNAATKLAKGDYSYNGDVSKWIKLTWGIRARNWHHQTNKGNYIAQLADSVIAFCDKSLASPADDFLIPFDAVKNDDANFFGSFRDNLTFLRQSNYIVKLLDGTLLAGSKGGANIDPRIKHMLSVSADSTGTGNGGYRGVDPGLGDPNLTSAFPRRRVGIAWADSTYANPSASIFGSFRKYVFGDKVVLPVMTSSEIQFIKAEAAFRSNKKAIALAAYTAGISQHFDFINRATFPRANLPLYNGNPIPASEKAAYLASANVKKTEASLTLADILLQKYIALWGWGFFETWVDLRRHHYTDIDPATGQQYYLGFALPGTIAPENLGKPVYRVRPRFNSEYVWNIEELRRIGALNSDYHTYEPWFSRQ